MPRVSALCVIVSRTGTAQVVSQSAFAFLFSELIQYSQTRVNTADELIAKCAASFPAAHQEFICSVPSHTRPVHSCLFPCRLEDAGVGIGQRILEIACWRDRTSKRETRMRGILQFITQTLWKSLFGAAADNLQRSVDLEDEYMIVEKVTHTQRRKAPPPSPPLYRFCCRFPAMPRRHAPPLRCAGSARQCLHLLSACQLRGVCCGHHTRSA